MSLQTLNEDGAFVCSQSASVHVFDKLALVLPVCSHTQLWKNNVAFTQQQQQQNYFHPLIHSVKISSGCWILRFFGATSKLFPFTLDTKHLPLTCIHHVNLQALREKGVGGRSGGDSRSPSLEILVWFGGCRLSFSSRTALHTSSLIQSSLKWFD